MGPTQLFQTRPYFWHREIAALQGLYGEANLSYLAPHAGMHPIFTGACEIFFHNFTPNGGDTEMAAGGHEISTLLEPLHFHAIFTPRTLRNCSVA